MSRRVWAALAWSVLLLPVLIAGINYAIVATLWSRSGRGALYPPADFPSGWYELGMILMMVLSVVWPVALLATTKLTIMAAKRNQHTPWVRFGLGLCVILIALVALHLSDPGGLLAWWYD